MEPKVLGWWRRTTVEKRVPVYEQRLEGPIVVAVGRFDLCVYADGMHANLWGQGVRRVQHREKGTK